MTQDGLSSSLPQPTPKNCRIDYERSLNPQQLSAVKSVQGPYLVIAGAGTGKTRTLVYRVAYLVESGLNPRNILLLTFSRRAARQMMKRASGILDNRCLNVSGGTFHAFANNVLRQFSHHIGFEKGFTIADRADAEDMIGSIRAEIGVAKKDKRTPLKKTICAVLSKGVNTGMSYEKIITRDYPQFIESLNLFCSLAEAYKSFKLARGIMDYDDLLVNLKELLLNHHEIRRGLSWNSRFIMVDEYQDTNRLQAEIVSLLASEHENIMVVGDDSQGIYSFRGADHKNIMEFPSLFPKATIIMLEQNYRSTQPILTLTNSIVTSMKEKYEKKLLTTIPHGEKPSFFIAGDIFEQASFVCEQVLKLREEGVRLRDIAVLFRSAYHSNELEIELTSRNIPFIKYGGRKFIEAAHVKDVLAFLRILLNPMDELAWFRTLGNLDGVGEVTAKRVAQQIVTNGSGINGLTEISYPSKKATNSAKRLCEGLSRINPWTTDPEEAVRLTLEYYIPVFREKFSDDFNRRMKDLEAVQRLAERCLDVESFLVDMALEPPESSLDSAGPSDKDKELLVLSTIHSAKGLEWHSVFLISLNDGCLPVTYSLGSDADLDEERRLFYVAATRAKRNLFLIHHLHKRTPKHQFGMEALNFEKPSRFILEISNFDDLTEKASWAPEPSLPPYPDNRQETHASGEGNSNATVDRIRKHFEGQ